MSATALTRMVICAVGFGGLYGSLGMLALAVSERRLFIASLIPLSLLSLWIGIPATLRGRLFPGLILVAGVFSGLLAAGQVAGGALPLGAGVWTAFCAPGFSVGIARHALLGQALPPSRRALHATCWTVGALGWAGGLSELPFVPSYGLPAAVIGAIAMAWSRLPARMAWIPTVWAAVLWARTGMNGVGPGPLSSAAMVAFAFVLLVGSIVDLLKHPDTLFEDERRLSN